MVMAWNRHTKMVYSTVVAKGYATHWQKGPEYSTRYGWRCLNVAFLCDTHEIPRQPNQCISTGSTDDHLLRQKIYANAVFVINVREEQRRPDTAKQIITTQLFEQEERYEVSTSSTGLRYNIIAQRITSIVVPYISGRSFRNTL